MVLGKFDIHKQKNKSRPLYYTLYKNLVKTDEYFNEKTEITKLLQKQQNFHGIEFVNNFLNVTSKVMAKNR